MMDTGADFQMWLEYMAQPQMAVIMPYVRSPAAGDVRYKVRVEQRSRRGSVATISQGGTVRATAQAPVSLTRIAVNAPTDNDTCRVELIVTGPDGLTHTKIYPCQGKSGSGI